MNKQEIVEKYRAALAKQLETIDGKTIHKEIVDELVSKRREISLRMLGLSDRWGEMEVENSSVVAAHIAAHAKNGVEEWLRTHLAEGLKAALERGSNKTVLKALKSRYRAEFDRCLLREITELASIDAKQAAREVAATLKKEITEGALSESV